MCCGNKKNKTLVCYSKNIICRWLGCKQSWFDSRQSSDKSDIATCQFFLSSNLLSLLPLHLCPVIFPLLPLSLLLLFVSFSFPCFFAHTSFSNVFYQPLCSPYLWLLCHPTFIFFSASLCFFMLVSFKAPTLEYEGLPIGPGSVASKAIFTFTYQG